MAAEWIDTTIGEQATLQRGMDITKAAQRDGTIPVISSGGVSSYHDTPAASGPGVILGRKGVVGSVYFVESDYWPHDTTLWVKDFHGNDCRFVYYFFKWMAPRIASMDVGSANPTLNRNHVHPIEIRWPPLNEQRAIAHILGTLDDKIELNRRMNETLEAMARAIFKSWFVDFDPVRAKAEGRDPGLPKHIADLFPDRFEDSELGEIPVGWRVASIAEVCRRIAMGPFGSDIKTDNFVDFGVPVVRGVNLTNGFARAIFDGSRPFYLKGTKIRFFVPFDGEEDCFKFQPTTSIVGPPSGLVHGRELVLSYTRLDHDAAAVRTQFERELAEIRSNLESMARDLAPFNNFIREKAKNRINARREKLLKDEGLAASLGYRLRPRRKAPQTYVAPSVRRKTIPSPPPASGARFVPEPSLDMQEYEHVLSVISNMVTVMERSPKAFRGMEEEDLRQHFLVQLNGQYEGQASGETFNFEGKTDILIRVEGKNIFIAECMFWRGPESLKKKIDQLLGYTSWRDTKVAILIFNREKNFSAVVSKIPEVVESHINFKRQLPYTSETGFRFLLHHRDDKNRELILTVLAFEVPA